MTPQRIFLASSAELKADREAFRTLLGQKNDDWVARGVYLQLVVWEDFLDAMDKTRLQDRYNEAIRDCDIFVMLFCSKVGMYTAEEFEIAFKQFQSTTRPFIFTYFKQAEVSTAPENRQNLLSLLGFQEKLKSLGHFQTVYKNTEDLQWQFWRQLDKLAASGFIELKPDDADSAAAPAHLTQRAEVQGSGAIAQGERAVAVGAGSVHVGGNNSGAINTQTVVGQGHPRKRRPR